jgi:hypothetical protein
VNGVRTSAICAVRRRPTLRVQSLVALARSMRRRRCAARSTALQPPSPDPRLPSQFGGVSSSEPVDRGQLIGAGSSAGRWTSEARSRSVSQSVLPHGSERSIRVGQDRAGAIESVGARRSLRRRSVLRHGVEPVVRGQAGQSSPMNTPRDCTLNVGRLRTALVAPWRSPFTGRRSGPKNTIAPR